MPEGLGAVSSPQGGSGSSMERKEGAYIRLLGGGKATGRNGMVGGAPIPWQSLMDGK